MKRRVVWSRTALDALKETVRFIARENPQAARKVARAIQEAGVKLGERAIGRRGRVSGTYEKPLATLPYVLVYALRPHTGGGELLVILHVIHMARSWEDESWPKT